MPIRRISENDVWVTNADGDVIGIQLHGRPEMVDLSNPVNAIMMPSGATKIYAGDLLIPSSITAGGGADVAITGVTTEQIAGTLRIPADFLGANGLIRGVIRWQYTNNANNKVMRVRLGGLTGASLAGMIGTTNGYMTYSFLIQNKGVKNAQTGNATDGIWQASTTAVYSSGAVDTTQALDVVVTGQLNVGTDNMTLKSWYMEAVHLD